MRENSSAQKIFEKESPLGQEVLEDILAELSVGEEVAEIVKKKPFIQEALLDLHQKEKKITLEHSARVAELADKVANFLNFSPAKKELFISSALVHDVGKLSVENSILDKPGELSEEEVAEVKKHPRESFEYLKQRGAMSEAEIAVRHHEFVKGYPRANKGRRQENPNVIYLVERRKGERRQEKPEFEELARLLSVLDIFEAMGSAKRPYNGKLQVLAQREKELAKFNLPEERKIIAFLEKDEEAKFSRQERVSSFPEKEV